MQQLAGSSIAAGSPSILCHPSRVQPILVYTSYSCTSTCVQTCFYSPACIIAQLVVMAALLLWQMPQPGKHVSANCRVGHLQDEYIGSHNDGTQCAETQRRVSISKG
jgi:hypothetical protein